MTSAFLWSDHIREIVWAAIASMIPMFEGRYAIAIMVGMGMPLITSYFIALFFSTLPMPVILALFMPVLSWLNARRISWLNWLTRFCNWVEKRAEQKGSKMNSIGMVGLCLFVAVPLPGTGVWTGSAIAAVFGMNKPKAALAIFIGNVIACALMAFLGLGVKHIA